jgi:hypothetical protein
MGKRRLNNEKKVLKKEKEKEKLKNLLFRGIVE